MNTDWFTADTHIHHGNIIKYCHRPFLEKEDVDFLTANGGVWHRGAWKGDGSSKHQISKKAVQRMGDTIIGNINDCVKPGDRLWHLGDVLFGYRQDYVRKAFDIFKNIQCKNVHLIWGNHDDYDDDYGCRLYDESGRTIKDLVKSTHSLRKIRVNNQMIVLCHYAMAVWEKSHRGSWHLYGHSHSNAEDWLNKIMPGRRSMDVGIDNAYKILGSYRPFSFEEIAEIMKDRHGVTIDHHIDPNAPTEEDLHQQSVI